MKLRPLKNGRRWPSRDNRSKAQKAARFAEMRRRTNQKRRDRKLKKALHIVEDLRKGESAENVASGSAVDPAGS